MVCNELFIFHDIQLQNKFKDITPTALFKQMECEYLKEFQQVYLKRSKYDLAAHIPYLARLAEDYKQSYLRTGLWTDCLRVSFERGQSFHQRLIAGSSP